MFGLIFWPEGDPYGPKCVVLSTQIPTRKADIPWEISGQDDPLLCYLSMDKGHSG